MYVYVHIYIRCVFWMDCWGIFCWSSLGLLSMYGIFQNTSERTCTTPISWNLNCRDVINLRKHMSKNRGSTPNLPQLKQTSRTFWMKKHFINCFSVSCRPPKCVDHNCPYLWLQLLLHSLQQLHHLAMGDGMFHHWRVRNSWYQDPIILESLLKIPIIVSYSILSVSYNHIKMKLVGFFQPIWKIFVKLDHFPNFRNEN